MEKQRAKIELGHRLLIATDQQQLIQDYDVPVGGADVAQSIPVTNRLLGRYGVMIYMRMIGRELLPRTLMPGC